MNCEEHRLYSTWKSMNSRCSNPNTKSYHNYGGRGITVCSRWRNCFWLFVDDMYPSFEEGLTLDRINNDGMYCKENCKWSTPKEQANNQNREYTAITYLGESYTEAELSRKTGIPRTTLQARRRKGYTDFEIVFGRESRKYLVDGVRYNLKELAEELGSYPQQVLRRLKKKGLMEVVNEFRAIQNSHRG